MRLLRHAVPAPAAALQLPPARACLLPCPCHLLQDPPPLCATPCSDRMSVPRGPCSLPVLREAWTQGVVDENTLVWGQVRWQAFSAGNEAAGLTGTGMG